MSKVRFISLLVVLALAMTAVGLVSAQDDLPGAGEGGLIIEANTRGSGNIGSLIDLRCGGVDCRSVTAKLYPSLVGLDPDTLFWAPGAPDTMATNWETSEDGLTWTITLRDDLVWTNGEPITAKDVYFSWDFTQQGETVGLSGSFSAAASELVGAEIIDDYTIQFTFGQRNCQALSALGFSIMPASGFGYEIGEDFDWSVMEEHPANTEPTVTSGVFKFNRSEPGNAIYLDADQNYAFAQEGFVRPEGWVFLDVPDFVVATERFLSFQEGELNYIEEPTSDTWASLIDGGAQFFSSPGTLWYYVGLNLGDPANPVNGLDEDGNPIEQDPHPIFGDKSVRQALQYATNVPEIIDGLLDGYATPMAAGTIPSAWTLNPDLEQRPFDLDMAKSLLDEAGWTDSDGDGVRECNGCATAEEGTLFAFDMINPGGVRNDISVVLQDQWAEIGAVVNVQPLDFNAMYDDNMGAQIYDAAVAGWRGGTPFDPDQRDFFGAENDIASAESYLYNMGSFYNARIEELQDIMTYGSCNEEEIYEAAQEYQEILYDEQPYIWLFAFDTAFAAAPNIEGFAPKPLNGAWNIDTWAVTSME